MYASLSDDGGLGEGGKVFQRNKVPLEAKVLAALTCFADLSYRNASKLIGGLFYVAVHDAFTALRRLYRSLSVSIVDA